MRIVIVRDGGLIQNPALCQILALSVFVYLSLNALRMSGCLLLRAASLLGG